MYVTPLDGKRWISGIKTTDAKKCLPIFSPAVNHDPKEDELLRVSKTETGVRAMRPGP